MKQTRRLLLVTVLFCLPVVASAVSVDEDINKMNSAQSESELNTSKDVAFNNLKIAYSDKLDATEVDEIIGEYRSKTGSNTPSSPDAKENNDENKEEENTEEDKKQENVVDQEKVDEAQKKYDQAVANEQSTANRMLGGLTIAATGIGGMQLAQGIAEKKADAEADASMRAYIETMTCKYANKTVKFSTEPVELPGNEVPELAKYRAEYVALAADLKERKEALDLKPGIEAEEILDKSTMGLYDDENVGITGGHYASRYRAAAGSEEDAKGLSAEKKEAKNRMIAGGVLAGAGVVGGIVGNSLINGKLGDIAKENAMKKELRSATPEQNKKAIDDLQEKAKKAGLKDYYYISKWNLEEYNIGAYTEYTNDIEFKSDLQDKKIEDLCPSLTMTTAESCADKLLTEESAGKIKSALSNFTSAGHGLGGLGSDFNITDMLSTGKSLMGSGGGDGGNAGE